MQRDDSSNSLNGLGTDTDNDITKPSDYKVRRSKLIALINWSHVCTTYYPHILLTLVAWASAQFLYDLNTVGLTTVESTITAIKVTTNPLLFDLGWRGTALVLLFVYWLAKRHQPVYLLDFCTFSPPASWEITSEQVLELMQRQKCFKPESIDFMKRIMTKSGMGEATAWPPGILKSLQDDAPLADRSCKAARFESETVICAVVKDVLEKTGTKAEDIDVLIINCSLFSPTPSLCAMVAHRFKMRHDIRSYNLSGMGCSAGVISMELAKSILASSPSTTALVISTENLTQNLYHGNDRSLLLQNTLFRCGGAAMVLSNKWRDGARAKFKLLHCVRVQDHSDLGYGCVYEQEDELGHHGVALSKDLTKVAGKAMERNFTTLGPYVLPLSEQAKCLLPLVCKWLGKRLGKGSFLARCLPQPKLYVPDFKRGIDHFCVHAGGRAVLDTIEENLNLTERHIEASRYVLHNFGNTSSSSIWYEMDYIRKYQGMRRGQRVLQLAFGSGFKCNTAVWLCLNN